MDTNIAESWNEVLKEAREYPLICMLEYIKTAVMCWFSLRRARATRYNGIITPHARIRVEKNFEKSTCLAVKGISGFEFQVQAPEGECYSINLMEGKCSCMEFQTVGILCKHALAGANSINVQTDALVAAAYYVDIWKRGYDGKIYHVPSVGSNIMGRAFSGDLMPPNVRRPPGRPKKVRYMSRGEPKKGKESGRRCTRCCQQEHNKASCRNAI